MDNSIKVGDFYLHPNQLIEVQKERIAALEAENQRLREALEKIDSWQGRQLCNASVYEIEDDDFSDLQCIVHEALSVDGRKDGS